MPKPTRSILFVIALVVAVILLTLGPRSAHGVILYQLDPATAYEEGCFEPCMCPVMMVDGVTGNFLLVPTDAGDGDGTFVVTDVDWRVRRGDLELAVTGGGTYTEDSSGRRLQLDLAVGDEPVRHFDSGQLAPDRIAPAIVIAVSVNGYFCYDHAFAITALPAAVGQEERAWGTVKAIWR